MNTTLISNVGTWSLEINIVKILIILVTIPICFLTAAGNVLVLLSFKINKKLRTTNNYFLMSLAIADLIIGFVSMPISTIYFITENWLFGPIICDLWLSLDYAVSNASVANLILISFDRYFSITRPLTYRVNRTTRKVVISISISWIVSFLVWTPFIISWPYIYGKRILADDECKVQFLYTNKYLTLSTCFIAFYLPVTIICAVYYRIWIKTKVRQMEFRKLLAANTIRANFNKRNSNPKVSIKNDHTNIIGLKLSNLNEKSYIRSSIDREDETDSNSVTVLSNENTVKKDTSQTSKNMKGVYLSEFSLVEPENKSHNSNLEKLNIMETVLNRFLKRRSSLINVIPSRQIDYSKCKLYFKSNNKQNQCKYCTNDSQKQFKKHTSEQNSCYSLLSSRSEKNPPSSPIFEFKRNNDSQLFTSRVDSQKSIETLSLKNYKNNRNANDKTLTERNNTLEKKQIDQNKKMEKKQDQKAAKTLSAILLAFIITWTPYNINVVVNAFCDNCLSKYVFWEGFAYWLCYMNSTINPILYALCNASFRKTFREILTKFKLMKKKS